MFAIDFEEELSGLHGKLLQDQAEFVNFCMKIILGLYDEADASTGTKQQEKRKIIAFGHSMGGVVLRLAYMVPNHVAGSVDTLLTLSSPHRDHPFQLDTSVASLYQRLHKFWHEELIRDGSAVSKTAVVSIAGGFRDNLIRTENTLLEGIVLPPTHGFSVSAYGVPGVRVSSDHLSIMWCR